MLVLLVLLLLRLLRLLVLLVVKVVLLRLHLSLQRHRCHRVWLEAFTHQQLIRFGPHAHHG